MNALRDVKIIFISHNTELYGANKSLLNLIDGLSVLDIDDIIIMVPSEGKIVYELKKRNVPYRIIPFYNEIYVGTRYNPFKKIFKLFFNWFLVLWYAKSLKARSKIIIHSNSSATLIGAYFSYWLRAPHIWHIREFGLEDYRYRYNFGNKYFGYWLNKTNTVIAISKAIYEKRVKDCTACRKKIIYNGVVFSNELQNVTGITKKKTPGHKMIFGIIGFISEEKNQLEALEAVNLLNNKFIDAELIITGTGNGEYIQLIKQKISHYRLDGKVVLTGYIQNTNTFYDKIDCLLMCSKNEALGRVTIEAMSKGLPVIGYDNAGTKEIIQHMYNGLLYTNGPQELCEMMQKIIENEELISVLKRNALWTVKNNFAIEDCTKKIIDIYDSCL